MIFLLGVLGGDDRHDIDQPVHLRRMQARDQVCPAWRCKVHRDDGRGRRTTDYVPGDQTIHLETEGTGTHVADKMENEGTGVFWH